MASYVKLWTTIYNDSWYKSLNSSQRGIWLGLIVYAKLHDDTGHLSFKDWTDAGSSLGCDGKTARKTLGKFRQDGKIDLKEEYGCYIIHITNYKTYQQLKDDKALKEYRKNPGNFRTNYNNNYNNNKKDVFEKPEYKDPWNGEVVE